MFWKILNWARILLSAILEAELNNGPGNGSRKRELVVKEASAELKAQGLFAGPGRCDFDDVVSYIGQLVDGAVGLFNCLGMFRTASTIPEQPPNAPAPDVDGAGNPI